MRTLDPDRWVLDQLAHTCAGPADCRACRLEEQLAETSPDESCRHYDGPDCEWCPPNTTAPPVALPADL